MVAVKAGQANSYLKSIDPRVRAVLFFGPDAGLVSERSERLAKHWASLEQPPTLFQGILDCFPNVLVWMFGQFCSQG